MLPPPGAARIESTGFARDHRRRPARLIWGSIIAVSPQLLRMGEGRSVMLPVRPQQAVDNYNLLPLSYLPAKERERRYGRKPAFRRVLRAMVRNRIKSPAFLN